MDTRKAGYTSGMKIAAVFDKWSATAVVRFLYTPYFLAVLGLIVVLCWALHATVVALAILLALFGLITVMVRDATPSLMVFLSLYFTFSPGYHTLAGNEWMIFLLFIPVAAIVAHCVIYRPRLRIRGYGVAVAVVTLPWVLQGLGRRIAYSVQSVLPLGFTWLAYAVVVGLGLLYWLLYLYFDAACQGPVGLRDAMLRFMLYAAIVVVVENIINVGTLMHNGKSLMVIFTQKWIDLGWGVHNQVASFYSLSIPITLYFAYRWRQWGWLATLLALVQYALMLLTYARGPMVFVTLAMPVMLGILLVRSPRNARLGHGIVVGVAVLAVVAVGIAKAPQVADALAKVLDKGLGNNGRFTIYGEAWQTFVQYPIFGGGFDIYYYTDALADSVGGVANLPFGHLSNLRAGIPYYFHSTFFQIIAAFGALGLVAYLYQFAYRYTLVTRGLKKDMARLFVLFSMVLFDLYGLIDTCFFSPVMHFMVLLLTLSLDKEDNYPMVPFLTWWVPKAWCNIETALEPPDLPAN